MMMPHPLLPVSLPPASVAMAMNQMNHLNTIANMAAAAQMHSPLSRAGASVIKVTHTGFDRKPRSNPGQIKAHATLLLHFITTPPNAQPLSESAGFIHLGRRITRPPRIGGSARSASLLTSGRELYTEPS